MAFTNWGAGEPNNAGGVEHFAAINPAAGVWLDIANEHPKIQGFICEWNGVQDESFASGSTAVQQPTGVQVAADKPAASSTVYLDDLTEKESNVGAGLLGKHDRHD